MSLSRRVINHFVAGHSAVISSLRSGHHCIPGRMLVYFSLELTLVNDRIEKLLCWLGFQPCLPRCSVRFAQCFVLWEIGQHFPAPVELSIASTDSHANILRHQFSRCRNRCPRGTVLHFLTRRKRWRVIWM